MAPYTERYIVEAAEKPTTKSITKGHGVGNRADKTKLGNVKNIANTALENQTLVRKDIFLDRIIRKEP